MEDNLKDFIGRFGNVDKSGFFKFKGEFYKYRKKEGDFVFSKIKCENFYDLFKIIAENKLDLFIKTVEGFIHNTNGKLTPVFSRLGLLESKIEEVKDFPEFRGGHRVYEKIFNSVKVLIEIYDCIGDFLETSTLSDKKPINLKRFFDGYYHAVITDRAVKHGVVFSFNIEENKKVSVNNSEFVKIVYFLGEAVFSQVRGKDGDIQLKISVNNENELEFLSEIFPFDFNSEDLDPAMLQSFMYFEFFKEICEKNEIVFEEFNSGLRIKL